MDVDGIRTAIEKALSACVFEIQVPGIVDGEARPPVVSLEQLQRIGAQLKQRGHSEITLSAEVELFLRISNTDVLRSVECTEFRVSVNAEADNLRAEASSEKDWPKAWERGIEPIKEAALQSMKSDVWNIDATLTESSYTFQSAMVLLASELIGPYIDRIATFLGYSPCLVQVIAARLHESQIWQSDEVRCESWFDPHSGGMAFLLDVMVANGQLMRKWFEEKKQFAYRKADTCAVSHLTV